MFFWNIFNIRTKIYIILLYLVWLLNISNISWWMNRKWGINIFCSEMLIDILHSRIISSKILFHFKYVLFFTFWKWDTVNDIQLTVNGAQLQYFNEAYSNSLIEKFLIELVQLACTFESALNENLHIL